MDDRENEAIVKVFANSRSQIGHIHLHRFLCLERGLFWPKADLANYGLILDSLAKDGDPGKAFLHTEYPVPCGCQAISWPALLSWATDEENPNVKLVLAPSSEPCWGDVGDLDDLLVSWRAENIGRITSYKDARLCGLSYTVACEDGSNELGESGISRERFSERVLFHQRVRRI
ncbi:inorganic diphosphatase [Ferrimicrobium sp.]|uniref:inorganic diphosphatase n=1 Tax=Ferrimicrobium sp. TaxID=2926050 RepID=UPI002626D389|nr:inorganic diphosphatase [Ferrimicrobium sp.]